ncbi:MAG: hypothetical protein ACRD2H_07520 [Terriglobales bacterium]
MLAAAVLVVGFSAGLLGSLIGLAVDRERRFLLVAPAVAALCAWGLLRLRVKP